MAEIRIAGENDVATVDGLIEALLVEVPDLVVHVPDLADPSTLVVVAEEAGVVVGYLIGLATTSDDEQRVVLNSVFVLPENRSQSIGRDLIWRFSDWAIELNCRAVHAEAPTSAPRAQDFLQQCGFNVRSVGRVQKIEAGSERNNVNDEQPWFSVRCHFALNDDGPFDYEERITLWRADSAEEAIESAENEACRYADSLGYRYLNACSSYHLFDTGFAVEGKEIYSEMRQSKLNSDAYLDRYFFTGLENGSDRWPSSPNSDSKLL